MRLALAPLNPTIGDLDRNAELILKMAAEASDAGADLVVFPELALTGYPPRDLLLQQGFMNAVGMQARRIGDALPKKLTAVFGTPLLLDPTAGRLANSLLAYSQGQMIAYYDKRLLPTYDVFDEDRYFSPGRRPVVIPVDGARVGLSVCEDLWRGHDVGFSDRYLDSPDPVAELCRPASGSTVGAAQLIVNPSASPFVLGKSRRHREILAHHAKTHGVHVAAVNQLGANDELIFDGHAVVIDPKGRVVAANRPFDSGLLICDLEPGRADGRAIEPENDPFLRVGEEELVYRALVLGVRDYARKTGFKSAVLGLSGGIDSAVSAVLGAAALGPANITGVSMPSRYSSEGSRGDAMLLASGMGMPMQVIPIESAMMSFEGSLAEAFAGKPADVTEENLQSRIRGTLLMAISNKHGSLLLTTGNKSELAVGYCTLYGDMNGGLAVLSDVTKILVYRLARWMNEHWAELGIAGLKGPPIPEASITKPPSAELRPNQTDQDSLPPYHILDEIIERYVERREAPDQIIAAMGAASAEVKRVTRLIDLAEFKRRQAALGLKVTSVAFGTGRRMPIAQRYRG